MNASRPRRPVDVSTTDRPVVDYFVIGCQRSGTTLMRLALDSHHLVSCIDEPDSYRVIAEARRPESVKALVGVKVPCLTEQFGDDRMWDRRLLPPTPNPYRLQPLIFLIRDVRDTVASMRSLVVGGRSWVWRSARPTVLAKRRRDPAFADRYRAWLRLADDPDDDIGIGAFYWHFKTDVLRDYRARAWPLLVVRYEDLVTQPAVELQRVCEFLEIPWDPDVLAHHRHGHDGLLPSGLATGNTDPARPIDADSMGRWQRILSAAEAERVVALAGELQQAFYPHGMDDGTKTDDGGRGCHASEREMSGTRVGNKAR
jgi:hypothetical protein